MLDILVAEICLQRPRIVPSVGEGVTASMPQHVRVWFEAELRLDPCPLEHPGEAGGGERCPPF